MKRLSLILLVLALVFTLACGEAPDSNKTTSNINKNGNYNSNTGGGASSGGREGLTPGDSSLLTIAVVVCYDANRAVQVRVTEPIYVSLKSQQKVRWCVYNDLDISLTSVAISAFDSGSSTGATLCSNAPNLTTGAIAPGNFDAVCTEVCATATYPSGTTFQYKVAATPNSQSEAVTLGPRVIIQ